MPLQLPNLDDRTYDDLLQEALSLIPSYAPEWTNYNPSDPGITLIEAFAYLTELLIYRLNQVTAENQQAFLNLISGVDERGQKKYPVPLDKATLEQEMQRAIANLRRSDRAVTCDDFEQLARAADPAVARAQCLPRRNLESENILAPIQDAPGHVSIVILPHESALAPPEPNSTLLATVSQYLAPRRLLTTQVHVVGPRYLPIRVQIRLMLRPDAKEAEVRTVAIAALTRFFSPLPTDPDSNTATLTRFFAQLPPDMNHAGWTFGRDVYVSEIYALLDQIPGVDYVVRSKNAADREQPEIILDEEKRDRLLLNDPDDPLSLVAVNVQPDELVYFQPDQSTIEPISPIQRIILS